MPKKLRDQHPAESCTISAFGHTFELMAVPDRHGTLVRVLHNVVGDAVEIAGAFTLPHPHRGFCDPEESARDLEERLGPPLPF